MFNLNEILTDKQKDILDKISYVIIIFSCLIICTGIVFVVSWNIHKDDAVRVSERSEIELLVTSYMGEVIDGEMLEILSENNNMEIICVDNSTFNVNYNYVLTGCTSSVLYVKRQK